MGDEEGAEPDLGVGGGVGTQAALRAERGGRRFGQESGYERDGDKPQPPGDGDVAGVLPII